MRSRRPDRLIAIVRPDEFRGGDALRQDWSVPMASLLITAGAQAGTYFLLGSRPLSAGRNPARDIQILDPKVSRKHFLIRREGEAYLLLPFDTVNGVIVNGEAIGGEVVLRDRDEIQVGDTMLRFELSDDPDRTNALQQYKLANRRTRDDQTISERSHTA
jgi:pSer/pThr/pTyr-binding forkhead associated (FHA) protein